MKIGINTYLWQWPFNSERVDLLKKIKNFGYDGVEMTIEDRSKENLEVIRDNIKKTNLECIVSSSFVEGNLISNDSAVIKKGVKYVKESINLCEYLGASILVGPTYGSLINKDFLNPIVKNKARQQAVELLKDIGKYLFHLHAPENDRGTPGTGAVDWRGIGEALKKINFEGFVVMESGSPQVEEVAKLGAFWRVYDYSQDKMTEEGLKFLRELLI